MLAAEMPSHRAMEIVSMLIEESPDSDSTRRHLKETYGIGVPKMAVSTSALFGLRSPKSTLVPSPVSRALLRSPTHAKEVQSSSPNRPSPIATPGSPPMVLARSQSRIDDQDGLAEDGRMAPPGTPGTPGTKPGTTPETTPGGSVPVVSSPEMRSPRRGADAPFASGSGTFVFRDGLVNELASGSGTFVFRDGLVHELDDDDNDDGSIRSKSMPQRLRRAFSPVSPRPKTAHAIANARPPTRGGTAGTARIARIARIARTASTEGTDRTDDIAGRDGAARALGDENAATAAANPAVAPPLPPPPALRTPPSVGARRSQLKWLHNEASHPRDPCSPPSRLSRSLSLPTSSTSSKSSLPWSPRRHLDEALRKLDELGDVALSNIGDLADAGLLRFSNDAELSLILTLHANRTRRRALVTFFRMSSLPLPGLERGGGMVGGPEQMPESDLPEEDGQPAADKDAKLVDVHLMRLFLSDAGYCAFGTQELDSLIRMADPEGKGVVRFGDLKALPCFALADPEEEAAEEEEEHSLLSPRRSSRVETLYAVVPPGVVGGDVITLEAEGGGEMTVVVPDGLSPGDTFSYDFLKHKGRRGSFVDFVEVSQAAAEYQTSFPRRVRGLLPRMLSGEVSDA